MKTQKIIVLMVVVTFSSHARESKVMNYLGNFVPSFTEVGILTNCVNVYDKVSQFVKTTSKMVQSVKSAKDDWNKIKNSIEEIYEDIQYLKNIDPYSIDSWESGINNFSFSLNNHAGEAIEAFDMLEYHTLDAGMNYVEDVFDFKKEAEEKKKNVANLFQPPSYKSQLANSAEAIKTYRMNTISQLRSLQTVEALVLQNSADPKEIEDAQQHYDELESSITKLETITAQQIQMEKPDSIIEQTENIIAINLTEIKNCKTKIAQMQQAASNLVAGYYRLIGQNLNSQVSGNLSDLPEDVNLNIDLTKFDPSDPDKVMAPTKPDVNLPDPTESKKSVSNHDIINLTNAANLLSLKQEALKRDLLAMKINTMAFMVSLEANKRNVSQLSGITQAHQFKMLEIALEDKEDDLK